MITDTTPTWVRYSQTALPWLLPALLLFSRAIADLTVLLTGILFLIWSFQRHDWLWARKPWFRLSLLLWAYLLLVNLPLSVDPSDSLLYAITFMRWPLFAAALAYWLLTSRDRQKHFLIALLFTSLFIVLDTGWQYVTGVDWFGIPIAPENRLTGPFRNPVAGIMMVRVEFILLLALAVFSSLQSTYRQVLFIVGILLSFLLLIFITGERMAFMLCVSASLMVLLGVALQYPARQKLVVLGGLLLILIIIALMFLLPEISQRMVFSTVEKLQNFRESDYGQVFRGAFEVWQHYPWFGSGLHSYQAVCNELAVMANTPLECTHPHNLYLHIGAETGIVGVSLFCLMVLAIFHQALMSLWRQKSWLLLTISSAILLLSFWPLIGGISLLNNWVAALVWLGVGWALTVDLQHSSAEHSA
ncbi:MULTISPECIES: O-antigen ligase family protein [unclassified Methylophaga]|jgi:O-antigen ligase|uniref:O-antigen ligase family protein n=1 Tax=unclassified Methylophaga TaxID=2629249 RepID=UPI000C4D9FF8|nr:MULTISPECIES: O-antigen ligase family protein [unclassified Methylophaga]MAM29046.1 polymerase [Flavobacteriaceae bacterium]MAL50723.1 polymerase [Methylophaga sp.]MBP23982.1 polymerase [Methylophaga sp.]HAD32659.1 polymerase [Methylophaga sp.]HCC80798.1 polymerase [Methylophaga sp.]|tara:strand:- start:7712 stop:8959 length:1248 start_codon:yes stop_codon:yes gene_type:complete